ncbi:amidohydrolase [Aliidiomarina iranensis]|uniref:Amidohydrolase n=1 Tax=Aliidiomarina iranensis TaxID=1434071 RepID=A0A432W2G3_9GAMM|nr:amidohydrolase family protein [Aliidiomarina iranensis]RUO23296.1 amidohydrolase [Aliidiomarina iranensis]
MNRFLSSLFFLIIASFLVGCQSVSQNTASETPLDASLVITNVNVIEWDGRDARISSNQAVVIQGDRIALVIDSQSLPSLTTGTQRIDGNNSYILPGFTEMHGHVPPATDFGDLPATYADDMLFLYIANGVTTVRGMLGYPHQLQLKSDIADGTRMGPTLYLAGPSFNGNSIESAEDATRRVLTQNNDGWDLLKIHPGLTLAEYQALARTAREASMDFAGHVPADVGLINALAEGQRTIDHLDGYLEYVDALNRPISDEELQILVNLTLTHETAIVPTQALWSTLIGAEDPAELAQYPELMFVPQSVRQNWLNYYNRPSMAYFNQSHAEIQQQNRQLLLKALHDANANIIFGTDAPQLFSVPGFSIHHEIEKMQAAGMPLEAIYYSATVAAGDYFADNDNFGHIKADQRADFMLLKDNPLESAHALKNLQGVLVRGQWLSREAIDAKLSEISERYN